MLALLSGHCYRKTRGNRGHIEHRSWATRPGLIRVHLRMQVHVWRLGEILGWFAEQSRSVRQWAGRPKGEPSEEREPLRADRFMARLKAVAAPGRALKHYGRSLVVDGRALRRHIPLMRKGMNGHPKGCMGHRPSLGV